MISNYEKHPVIFSPGIPIEGWSEILTEINEFKADTIIIECYHGVNDDEVIDAIRSHMPEAALFLTSDAMKEEKELFSILKDDITDDRIFGYMTRHTIDVYFDKDKVHKLKEKVLSARNSKKIVYGVGSTYILQGHLQGSIVIYLDMARWEIQLRQRRHEVSSVGFSNRQLNPSYLYKQGFFVDWRILDRWKKKIWNNINFFIDTNAKGKPKMIHSSELNSALDKTVRQPFRVVPYFDMGVWGGQWMKDVCDLDKNSPNYAWCFDCVPEENSLLYSFNGVIFEFPAIDLVFQNPEQLLGKNVYGRFGDEFPIRFDFLDTMDGGNLSLQVHPLISYIQERFGMHYTQEESYYILDAKEDAHVFLGVKNGINPEELIDSLQRAQTTSQFDAEKYIGKYPVKKHDHVLIPPGTIHCSGKNSMVLEISATPYIFTFKLWDWGRLGLDGLPRPINIEHGKNVIRWDRNEDWVRKEAINAIEPVFENETYKEEHTGLHEFEFIETRRHWFKDKVTHFTDGGVNVLNLVEGREAVVESPTGKFKPYIVHYAETFIIPATVGEYTIRPYGESEGKLCATIKAYVRKNK